jgi:hypothetical protein
MSDDIAHQTISRPQFHIGAQRMFRVYRVPFRSYERFPQVNDGDLSIAAARGVFDRKLRRRSFRVSVRYTLFVYHAPLETYTRFSYHS